MSAKYLDVAQALRTAIRNGEYAQKPFPSEAQLMRKFGIGRQTAVRVLNELVGEGLVVRRKGAGTFLSQTGRKATIDLPAGLLQKGGNEIQFRNTTPDTEAAQDGEGGDLFRAKRNYFWGWFNLDKVTFVLAD